MKSPRSLRPPHWLVLLLTSAGIAAAAPGLTGKVLDNEDAELSGPWQTNNASRPRVGQTYLHDQNTAKGECIARYRVRVGESGRYEVLVSWPPHPNRATNVPVTVRVGDVSTTVKVNQRRHGTAGAFTPIGKFQITDAAVIEISNRDTDGHVIADAVRVVPGTAEAARSPHRAAPRQRPRPRKADPDAPNILLLFADDLGYEALGSYGGLDFQTPRLDAFARESVRFSRAYTSAVCTPSRMSYYTGRYTVNHGHHSVLPVHRGTRKAVDFRSLPTVAQALRHAGYATSVTGKWQLATLEFHPDHIESAGFESWCVWQIWRDGAKTTRYWNPCFNHNGRVREDIADRFGPDVLADYVIDRMRQAVAEKRPFYIHHNMLLPHWPILETPTERESGQAASLGNMIAYLDGLVGRILTAVDDLGIAENTWVIFMGDNGTDSKAPRRTTAGEVHLGKHHLTEAGTHIPLLIRGPGRLRPGTVVNDLVDITDFFPTLCGLGRAEIPEDAQVDGISFAPRLLGMREKPHRTFVTAGLGRDYFVFDGHWRLHARNAALYDCRRLPREIEVMDDTPETIAAREHLGAILECLRR